VLGHGIAKEVIKFEGGTHRSFRLT
jgi:hypothetical protein